MNLRVIWSMKSCSLVFGSLAVGLGMSITLAFLRPEPAKDLQ
jgi:hypothetical protein